MRTSGVLPMVSRMVSAIFFACVTIAEYVIRPRAALDYGRAFRSSMSVPIDHRTSAFDLRLVSARRVAVPRARRIGSAGLVEAAHHVRVNRAVVRLADAAKLQHLARSARRDVAGIDRPIV